MSEKITAGLKFTFRMVIITKGYSLGATKTILGLEIIPKLWTESYIIRAVNSDNHVILTQMLLLKCKGMTKIRLTQLNLQLLI